MPPKSYAVVPECSLLLVREGKIFLVRRANTGYEDGKYCMPAGHKEEGESPTRAIIREAKEEVGVDIHPKHLTLVHTMYRKGEKDERPSYFFHASEWVGEPANTEPEKADDGKWFHLSELPDMMGFQKIMLDRYRAGKTYSEWGWEE